MSSQLKLIHELNQLSRDGRSIVPLLGAGISIEAGIPSLGALTRYLAKVQLYIRKRLYRPKEELDGIGQTKHGSRASTSETSAGPTGICSKPTCGCGWPMEARQRNHFGDRRQRWMDRLVQGEVLEHFKRLDQPRNFKSSRSALPV